MLIDDRMIDAYAHIMRDKNRKLTLDPCLCNFSRQASRAVSRLYDEELRSVGIRNTQYSLLRVVSRLGEVQQGELGALVHLDQTTLTRNLRPLLDAGWVSSRKGKDQRERMVAITKKGYAMLALRRFLSGSERRIV